MPDARAYLDWNATAPLLPEARAAMLAALELNGNPSSVHQEGRAARRTVEEARADVAMLVGGEPDRVVFTSGALDAFVAGPAKGRSAKAVATESEAAQTEAQQNETEAAK